MRRWRMYVYLDYFGFGPSLDFYFGDDMNLKTSLQKDFLKMQRILRELRQLRYTFYQNTSDRECIERAIKELGPLSDKLKLKLESMQKPAGDYDI
jgi:hypothetical protein